MSVKQASFGGMANNCYLLVDDKTNESALIDCPEYNEKTVKLIGNTDLKYVLLTHGHYDHIMGVKEVKENYNCKIAISKEDAPMLSSSALSLAAFCGADQKSVCADILLDDGDEITIGETKISVLKTPGHTKGSLCFLCKDGLFSGDTLFRLSCGRTDFPGGSWEEMQCSLKRLSEIDGEYTVFTGHDSKTSLDFERKNNPYMKML